MAVDYTAPSFSGGIPTGLALTTAFADIETALKRAVSIDGDLPNAMEADLDLNGHDLLNVGEAGATIATTAITDELTEKVDENTRLREALAATVQSLSSSHAQTANSLNTYKFAQDFNTTRITTLENEMDALENTVGSLSVGGGTGDVTTEQFNQEVQLLQTADTFLANRVSDLEGGLTKGAALQAANFARPEDPKDSEALAAIKLIPGSAPGHFFTYSTPRTLAGTANHVVGWVLLVNDEVHKLCNTIRPEYWGNEQSDNLTSNEVYPGFTWRFNTVTGKAYVGYRAIADGSIIVDDDPSERTAAILSYNQYSDTEKAAFTAGFRVEHNGETYKLAEDARMWPALDDVADVAALATVTGMEHGNTITAGAQKYYWNTIVTPDAWVAWDGSSAIPSNPLIDPLTANSNSWGIVSLSINRVRKVGQIIADIQDYRTHETNGVQNREAWIAAIAENDVFTIHRDTAPLRFDGGHIEVESGKYIQGIGQPEVYLGGDSYFGYDGEGESAGLQKLRVEGITFRSESRSDTAPLVRFESEGSFGGILNTAPVGGDVRRGIAFRDVHILGTGKTGIGLSLQGVYIAEFYSLLVQQVALGLELTRSPRTSYGCNDVHFYGGEVQGVKKLAYIHDFQDITFPGMGFEGSEEGCEVMGPGRGLTLPQRYEGNGTSTDPLKKYDIKIDAPSSAAADMPFNIIVPEGSSFADGQGNKDHAIWLVRGRGIRIGGGFTGYGLNPVRNMAAAGNDVQAKVENVVGTWGDTYSPSELPSIDKETAFVYQAEKNNGMETSEVISVVDVATEMASFTVPSLGWNNNAKPIKVAMFGQLATTSNKRLSVKVNGVEVPGMVWNTSEQGRGFEIHLNLIPTANNAQRIVATVNGYAGSNPPTKTAATSVNIQNTGYVVSVECLTSGANGMTKHALTWDKGH